MNTASASMTITASMTSSPLTLRRLSHVWDEVAALTVYVHSDGQATPRVWTLTSEPVGRSLCCGLLRDVQDHCHRAEAAGASITYVLCESGTDEPQPLRLLQEAALPDILLDAPITHFTTCEGGSSYQGRYGRYLIADLIMEPAEQLMLSMLLGSGLLPKAQPQPPTRGTKHSSTPQALTVRDLLRWESPGHLKVTARDRQTKQTRAWVFTGTGHDARLWSTTRWACIRALEAGIPVTIVDGEIVEGEPGHRYLREAALPDILLDAPVACIATRETQGIGYPLALEVAMTAADQQEAQEALSASGRVRLADIQPDECLNRRAADLSGEVLI